MNTNSINVVNPKIYTFQCPFHNKPEIYYCLAAECKVNCKLSCANCIIEKHPHTHAVYGVKKFIEFVHKLVDNSKQELKTASSNNVANMIAMKKGQIEEKHKAIIKKIVDKLNIERETAFKCMDNIVAEYNKSQANPYINISKRINIVQYLDQYVQAPNLIEIKLLSASQQGLLQFKQTILALNQLRETYKLNPLLKWVGEMQNSIKQKLNMNYSDKLNQFLSQFDKITSTKILPSPMVSNKNIPYYEEATINFSKKSPIIRRQKSNNSRARSNDYKQRESSLQRPISSVSYRCLKV